MLTVYGIKNCDTVQKALTWLKNHNIEFEFHDFKKSGIGEDKLTAWAKETGWEPLVNKRGTTWKKLAPEVQQGVTSEDSAFKLMQEKTSVIKRPVIESEKGVMLGFDEEKYNSFFA